MERQTQTDGGEPRQTEPFVNYLPAMASLPSETSLLVRAVTRVFRRRGTFIPRE